MRCNNRRLNSTGPSLSSGPSLGRQTKTRSRAHVWISSRRAHATHNWKNAVGLLAGKFCPAARTRFLDRFAGRGEFASGHDLCCEKWQAARASAILSRPRYARYVSEKDLYVALWVERHKQDE